MRGSDTATKERIKEIKFVKEDFNVEKLIRNKTTRLASTTSNYLRTSIITSRSMEVTRTQKHEEERIKKRLLCGNLFSFIA